MPEYCEMHITAALMNTVCFAVGSLVVVEFIRVLKDVDVEAKQREMDCDSL